MATPDVHSVSSTACYQLLSSTFIVHSSSLTCPASKLCQLHNSLAPEHWLAVAVTSPHQSLHLLAAGVKWSPHLGAAHTVDQGTLLPGVQAVQVNGIVQS